MTKFGAAENKMERLTAKFAQRTPTEHPLFTKTQKKITSTKNFCSNPIFSLKPSDGKKYQWYKLCWCKEFSTEVKILVDDVIIIKGGVKNV